MKSNAERGAARRARDRQKSIVQVNIRVPELYDVGLKLLAEDLRKGMRLEGVVLRDPKTGRVSTRTI
jgi:hypothetical protein